MGNKEKEFIDNRINYLESLKNLPDDWINGDSISPSRGTIDNAIKIFRAIAESEVYNIMEILMSPTLDGNISFGILIDNGTMLLTIEVMED